MLNQDLYVFALALGISGFIAYKTFQWVLYEEIGPGAAALFLAFAILVFFGVNNHDLVKEVMLDRHNQAAGQDALERMGVELQREMETTKSFAETAGEVAERARELAMEANTKGEAAFEEAARSRQSLEQVASVTAWAAWELLMKEFHEVEGYLRRWEEKNGLTRGRIAARSLPDLARRLAPLADRIPETIQGLYFERQRKYEILKKIKESSEFASSRPGAADFALPPPPGLPVPVVSSSEQGGKPKENH